MDAVCLSGMLDLTVKEMDRLLDEGISYGYDYCKSVDKTVELWENLTPELKALLLRDDYAEYAYHMCLENFRTERVNLLCQIYTMK